MNRTPTTWVEVNLTAIRHNLREVRKIVGESVGILAVVKADAYGCGAVEVSKAVLAEGASGVAVTRLEDALELRSAGISSPVLVFNSCLPEDAPTIVEHDLDQTICSTALAQALSKAARAQKKTARVHVKVDTGLGRLGVAASDAVDFVRAAAGLPGLSLSGVYTHFATAAERDHKGSIRQLEAFEAILRRLRTAEVDFGAAHAAASAAILRMSRSHFNMVRPGTLLYGQYPSSHVPKFVNLRNPWAFKARVAFVKTVPAGALIGYGSEFRTRRPSTIAIIPVGYADGLTMQPESVFRRSMLPKLAQSLAPGQKPVLQVRIKGKAAPVVGRIAMEMCVIDVSGVPGVQVGDEVDMPCRRTAVTARIPRVYVEDQPQG